MNNKMGNDVVYVNGIYLTPAAIGSLDYLQTGGTIDNGIYNRKFNNEGLNALKTELAEANKIIVKSMLEEEIEEAKAISLLRIINDAAFYLESLAAPAFEKELI